QPRRVRVVPRGVRVARDRPSRARQDTVEPARLERGRGHSPARLGVVRKRARLPLRSTRGGSRAGLGARYTRAQADFALEPLTLPSALSFSRCACTWWAAMS